MATYPQNFKDVPNAKRRSKGIEQRASRVYGHGKKLADEGSGRGFMPPSRAIVSDLPKPPLEK